MVGIAVATTVPSIAAMKMQITAAVMIHGRLAPRAKTALSSARAATAGSVTDVSVFFDPGPELDLGRPSAAMLAMDGEIAGRDRVRFQECVRAAILAARIAGLADAAIDHEMRDMDVLRCELARHALRQAAQPEFPHREGGREREAFDAGRSAREKDRAVAGFQHQPRGLLADEEAAIAADHDRVLHLVGLELGDRAARPPARVVDNEIGRREI